MSESQADTVSGDKSSQKTTTLPSRLPTPTGNIIYDSLQSALHVTAIPCARESLLGGIAAGAGIGFIRGFSLPPIKAGNWAVATFAITSIISWQICQKKIEQERRQVATVLEHTPRRHVVAKDTVEEK